MNNGENNQNNLSIEPVPTNNTVAPTIQEVPNTQVQPQIQPQVNAETPSIEQAVPPAQEEKKEFSLGANVKIAPAQSFYDENGKINEIPKKEEVKIVQPEPSTVPENTPPQIQMRVEEQKVETTIENNNNDIQPQEEQINTKPPRKRSIFTPLLLLTIIGLGAALYYFNQNYQKNLQEMNYSCSPVSTTKETKELSLDSTIVKDLYSKVATDIREDYAHNEFDEELKRYLAFRQISTSKFYESNCNLFNQERIYNYKCEMGEFTPKAIKEDTLELEIKKLFGEKTTIAKQSVQLGRQCVGGYEYIPERGEYVEGECTSNIALSIKVEKELKKATSKDNIITIEEEVKYIGTDKQTVPDYLQSGIFTYTFKLDTNYNYVLIDREFNTKY